MLDKDERKKNLEAQIRLEKNREWLKQVIAPIHFKSEKDNESQV